MKYIYGNSFLRMLLSAGITTRVKAYNSIKGISCSWEHHPPTANSMFVKIEENL